MCKVPLFLALVAAITATAVSQEIVIEPTNGRPQTATHISRPASVDATPVESKKASAKPANASGQQPARRAAKKAPAKQLAKDEKATPAAKPAVPPATVASAPVEAAPAPKRIPERPEWALSDTRDVRSMQTEIASALANDPKLSGSSIEVKVDDGSVLLQGHAAGTEERLQAERLAQSYAWNRKVVDKIAVTSGASAQR